MKKGFTLVEMLIVVVVLVTLMSITFRLSSLGSDQEAKTTTVTNLQKLENCLSGYYAAFGSYPPVKLHGSRNIYAKASEYGIQSRTEENKDIWGWTKIGDTAEAEAWRQVKAACMSQPVECRFPYPSEQYFNDYVIAQAERLKKEAESPSCKWSADRKAIFLKGFDNGVTDNIGRHDKNAVDWQDVQLFKFGLLSYLLPRYFVMMGSNEELYTRYAQWTANNPRPFDQLTGERMSWGEVYRYINKKNARGQNNASALDYARVSTIPSQAACARWLPNLEKSLITSKDGKYVLYGIDVINSEITQDELTVPTTLEVHEPGGYEGGGGMPYVLDYIKIVDGFNQQPFYYYSPPPYQSYTLWSAGPNKRTFPPWISRKTLSAQANRCVGLWIEDDIVRMSK